MKTLFLNKTNEIFPRLNKDLKDLLILLDQLIIVAGQYDKLDLVSEIKLQKALCKIEGKKNIEKLVLIRIFFTNFCGNPNNNLKIHYSFIEQVDKLIYEYIVKNNSYKNETVYET